jgi:hypothetical protein
MFVLSLSMVIISAVAVGASLVMGDLLALMGWVCAGCWSAIVMVDQVEKEKQNKKKQNKSTKPE